MITQKLGVSKAAIYHHFQSKDELIITLLQPVILDVQGAVTTVKSLPEIEQPHSMLFQYIKVIVSHRTLISTVFFDPITPRVISESIINDLINDVSFYLAKDKTTQEAARIASVSELREMDDEVVFKKLLSSASILLK